MLFARSLAFVTIVALVVFLFSRAHAQQPQQTPREQALTQKLIAEINAGLACSGNVIALQEALKKAQDELAALKKAPDKSEKKKP